MKNLVGILVTAAAVIVVGCSQQEKQAEAPKVEKVSINVPTSKCASCQKTITKAVKKVDGVNTVDVNVETHVATVEFVSTKTNTAAIEQAIAGAGYDANNVKRNEEAYNHLPDCCK